MVRPMGHDMTWHDMTGAKKTGDRQPAFRVPSQYQVDAGNSRKSRGGDIRNVSLDRARSVSFCVSRDFALVHFGIMTLVVDDRGLNDGGANLHIGLGQRHTCKEDE